VRLCCLGRSRRDPHIHILISSPPVPVPVLSAACLLLTRLRCAVPLSALLLLLLPLYLVSLCSALAHCSVAARVGLKNQKENKKLRRRYMYIYTCI
jgi:hypothetical protein